MRRRIRERAEAAQKPNAAEQSGKPPDPEEKGPDTAPSAGQRAASTPEEAEVPIVETAPAQKGKHPLPYNGPLPEMSTPMQRVIEKVFSDIDPPEDYAKLEKGLSLNDALTPGVIQAALNRAEDNARMAHKLYVAAKLDYSRFEVDANITMGAMRSAANAALQVEKDNKQRNKSITDADVSDRAAIMFPDEWRVGTYRKNEAEMAIEHLRQLADLWKTRCYSLSAMLNAGKR